MLARRHARSDHDAEDLAQEALLRAWRHRASLKSRAAFSSWLAQIVRNEAARSYSRSTLATISIDDVDVLDESESHADEVATRDEIAGVLAQLDPQERRLVELRYVHDMTQPAIAAQLSMPEGTIKVRLHRARHKLHRALSDP